MNDDILGFQVELTDDDVRALYYAVCEAIKMWPGYPARPLEEQQRLQELKEALFSMTLEMVWDKEV